jgi:hypothetical protein
MKPRETIWKCITAEDSGKFLFCIREETSRGRELAGLFSTYHELIPARNTIKMQQQASVTNDELPIPVLKAYAQYMHSLHTT